MKQIPLVYKSKDDLKAVITICKKLNYKIMHCLDDIDSIKEHIVAIVLDTEYKEVFQSNVTCMACWCSSSKEPRKPLYADQFVENYEKLLIEKDDKFYNKMIRRNFKLYKKSMKI
ncbi:MAG: hypothetical protein MJ227_00865 [Bacilli bacterium]|nr:hypothetical protein [Bacilli bacterium]